MTAPCGQHGGTRKTTAVDGIAISDHGGQRRAGGRGHRSSRSPTRSPRRVLGGCGWCDRLAVVERSGTRRRLGSAPGISDNQSGHRVAGGERGRGQQAPRSPGRLLGEQRRCHRSPVVGWSRAERCLEPPRHDRAHSVVGRCVRYRCGCGRSISRSLLKPEQHLSIKVQRIDLAASTATIEITFG